jgi:hypothetical protein
MPLTVPELRTTASFLRQAVTLVESVKDFSRFAVIAQDAAGDPVKPAAMSQYRSLSEKR